MNNSIKVLLLTLLFVLTLFSFVESVDQSKFKTCSEAHFCKRNRQVNQMKSYALVESSVIHENGIVYGDILVDGNTEDVLSLEMMAYQDNILRFKIKEKNPLAGKKRYEVQDVLLPSIKIDNSVKFLVPKSNGNNEFAFQYGSNENQVIITLKPFKIDIYINKELSMTINERNLFHFEQIKEKPQPPQPQLPQPKPEQNDDPNNNNNSEEDNQKSQHDQEIEGYWQERFQSHQDSKPNGPMSIGLDFTFVGSKNVYGIPEHASSLSLKNTKGDVNTDPYRLYNLDVFEYELDKTMALYGSIPLMISHDEKKTIGLFWLNAAETFIDIEDGKKGKETHWISETGIMDVFVLAGPTPKKLFQQYATLTGTTTLPQMFALAYHQSRWNYKSEEDVREVDKGFDEHMIPYDVLWLDIEHTNGKRYFTWDKSQFPTPDQMLKGLDEKSRKLVTIVDPHIKRDDGYYIHSEATSKGYYVKNREGNDYNGWCWPGSSSYLDFTNPIIRDWWASQFAYDKYEGSAKNLYIWNDMNEPSVFDGPEVSMHKDAIHHGSFEHRDVHNLYGYYYHMATANGLIQRNPDHNDRPFVLSRAFFAGTQRVGAIWTGDNAAKWDHLAVSNPMLLSIALTGISFSGADVGGFFGNPDAQLLTRWYQAGAFQPFFRGHAHLDSRRREPWLFGEPYTSVIRQAIQTRYSYLPYWYTVFYQNNQTGMPVMRPLWVEFPKDQSLFALEDQFMIGDALLVKPVVNQDQASTQVILPGDKSQLWYEVDTDKKFQAGTTEVKTPLEKIPVFQRGGTVIPKKERIRRSSQLMKDDPYTIRIALDSKKKAYGELYIDDEHSFNYQTKKQYLYKSFTFENNQLTFKDAPSSKGKFDFDNTIEKIIILGVESKPTKVLNDKTSLSFEYEQSTQKLTIRKPELSVNSNWVLNFN